MPFLPPGYTPPVATGRYLRPEKNSTHVFRILSETPDEGWEYWTDDADGPHPHRSRQRPDYSTLPPNLRISDRTGRPELPKFLWILKVWHQTAKQVMLWEVKQSTVQAAIADLCAMPAWGDPINYDLQLKRDDTTGQTRYSLTPMPGAPMTPEIMAQARAVDVDAWFAGGDPFLDTPVGTAAAGPGMPPIHEPATVARAATPVNAGPRVTPMKPNELHRWLQGKATAHQNGPALAAKWEKPLIGVLNRWFSGDEGRHMFLEWAFGVSSSKDLSVGQWWAIYHWLRMELDPATNKFYPDQLSVVEAQSVATVLTPDDEDIPF